MHLPKFRSLLGLTFLNHIVHCVLCLINIMDIFPSAVNTIINHQGVAALSQKIQNLEYIDLAEKAIRALERISSESANSVLNNASLDIILNMMDFFELDVQICILKMISNVGISHASMHVHFTEKSDWEVH